VDWMLVTQDRDQCWAVVDMSMNLGVPQKAGNCLSSLSVRTLLHGVCRLSDMVNIVFADCTHSDKDSSE
jgi:hypothetical protein